MMPTLSTTEYGPDQRTKCKNKNKPKVKAKGAFQKKTGAINKDFTEKPHFSCNIVGGNTVYNRKRLIER